MSPPLVLIGVIFFACLDGARFGFFLGVFAGIFFEIYGVGPLGRQMLVMGLIGAGAGALTTVVFFENFLIRTVMPAAAFYFASLLNLMFVKTAIREPLTLGLFGEAFFWNGLLVTVFVSWLQFAVLEKIFLKKRKRTQWV